nr:M48 family metalloprotease [Echinimonas agarilytica]
MRQIRGSYPLLQDPALQEYLESVGYKLVTAGSTPVHPFTFFLIKDPNINAFAFFGGHVGVHTGLFMNADTEGQLASVLAHEIAHVNQRHLARRMESQMDMQAATIGATLGSILLTVLAPQAGIAALQTTLAASQQMSINFTRKNEAEADRIGMQTLVAAGFDPYAAPEFFGKLAAQYRFASKPPAFLLTHPVPETRVADAQLRAQQFPRKAYPQNIDYQFAKARIEARYSGRSSKAVIQRLEQQIARKEYINKDAALYGLALAQFDDNDAKAALETITPLAKKYPRNLFLVDSLTDINMKLKQPEKAEERLKGFYGYMPDNQVIALNYANILIEQEKSEEAIEILKLYRQSRPDDLLAIQLIGDAYSQIGNTGQQYSAKADGYALMAQYEQAIAMLERALRATPVKDNIEVVKLEAKVRQYRNELARLKTL